MLSVISLAVGASKNYLGLPPLGPSTTQSPVALTSTQRAQSGKGAATKWAAAQSANKNCAKITQFYRFAVETGVKPAHRSSKSHGQT